MSRTVKRRSCEFIVRLAREAKTDIRAVLCAVGASEIKEVASIPELIPRLCAEDELVARFVKLERTS